MRFRVDLRSVNRQLELNHLEWLLTVCWIPPRRTRTTSRSKVRARLARISVVHHSSPDAEDEDLIEQVVDLRARLVDRGDDCRALA